MLTRSQKLIVLLITWLPVLALVIVSAIYINAQINRLLKNADVIIAQELAYRFKREVSVGRAFVQSPGVAVLENVQIAEGKTLAAGRMVVVKKIIVHYSLRGLLEGRGAGAVSEVEAIDPRILLVRRPDGTFNVQDLLRPPPGPPGRPFTGTVKVTGGSVVFKDFLARTKVRPAVTRLHDLEMFLDAAKEPKYSFRVEAQGESGKLKSVQAAGVYDAPANSVSMDLSAKGVSASYWAGYVGLPDGAQVLAGSLRLAVGVNFSWADKHITASVMGSAKVAGVSARVPGLREPVEDVSGSAIFSGDAATVKLSGSVAGSPVEVSGTIVDFQKPKLNLVVTMPAVDFGRLAKAFELPPEFGELRFVGKGTITAKVMGPLAEPTIEVIARIPRVTIAQVPVQEVTISGVYRNKQITVPALRLRIGKAEVEAAGTIGVAPPHRLSLKGRLQGVPLASLPIPTPVPVTGTAYGTFAVSGTAARPVISVSATVPSGALEGVLPFQSASAEFTVAGKTVRIQKFVAGVAGGVIRAHGSATPQRLDLTVTAEGLDVSRLARPFELAQVGGTAYFSGSVTGSPGAPIVSGNLQVFNGRYRDFDFDLAQVALTASERRVEISRGIVRMYPAEIAFSGAISGFSTRRIAFRGTAHVEQMNVRRALALLGSNVDVTGVVSGDITGSGVYLPYAAPTEIPFTDTSAAVDLRLEDGTAYGLLINSATLVAGMHKGDVTLRELTVRSEEAVLTASGTASIDTGALNLDFALSDLELMRLAGLGGAGPARTMAAAERYVVTGGVLGIEGTVFGTIADPTITADGQIANPTLDYKKFDSAQFAVVYSGGVLESYEATLTRGAQVYALQGTGYDIDTNCLKSAGATITNASVRDLWDMLRASPYMRTEQGAQLRESLSRAPALTSGELNASLQLSGCLANPDGSLNLAATDVGIDVQKIDSVNVQATAEQGVVTLEQFKVVSGEMIILATGAPVYEQGKLQLELNAQNLDLSRLRPWLGDRTPGGMMSAEFRVEGEYYSPRVIGSIEVVNPSYAGLTFDRLRASTIEFTQDRIDISDVILSVDGHQAVAHGYLPWEWAPPWIPADKPLELTATLGEQDLSLLAFLTPVVDAAGTSGTVQAQMNVSGTLESPELSGSAQVRNGAIAFTAFTETIENLNADLLFEGDRLVVEQFSAQPSLGGSISIAVGSYITVGALADSSVELTAENVTLEAPHFENTFTGINANLVFDGERVEVRQFSAESSLGGALSIVPGSYMMVGTLATSTLNLLLAVDKLVIAENNLLGFDENVRMQIDAGLSVTGSLAGPLVADAPAAGEPGGATVSNAEISFMVPEESVQPGKLELPVNPRFDVTLTVGEDVRVAPPNMSLLLAGSGTLKGTLAEPDLKLTLQVLQGTIRLAVTTLRIEPGGEIYVTYAPPEVRVDLQAATTVFATNPFGQRERYRITIDVTGPITNLQVNLTSSPSGLTREQMLAALGHVEGIFTTGEAGLQQELTDVLSAVGTSALFAPIENLFIERLGFEQFTLEFAPMYPLALYLSTPLFGNYYLSLYRRLTGGVGPSDQTYQLILSYRPRGPYQFSIGVDDQQTTTLQVGFSKLFR